MCVDVVSEKAEEVKVGVVSVVVEASEGLVIDGVEGAVVSTLKATDPLLAVE